MAPKYINFHFEKKGEITEELELRAKEAFFLAGTVLEKEWGVSGPIDITVSLQDDASFRGGQTTGPESWKYCFLMEDPRKITVYCNIEIFSVLPDDAEKMIKHETAHLVVNSLVGDLATIRRSYFLHEGTAGLDGATERFVTKMKPTFAKGYGEAKKENVTEVRDPLSMKSMDDIRGDTNKEPFIDQIDYLTIFSAVEFLRKRIGERKIIEVFKNIRENGTIEESYERICGEDIGVVISEWEKSIKSKLM
jgi:hypothetical protein